MRNEELIVSHKNYACAIAISRRFHVRDYEIDDMVSEAQLALVIAGRRFDHNHAMSFTGWVRRRVVGALDDWAVSRKQRYGMSAQGRGHRGAVTPRSNPFVRLTARNAGVEYFTLERSVLLDAALASLPARLRDVIRRRFWQSETVEEIAVFLGVTEGRVSQLTKRGLGLLRQELALRGVRKVADLV